MHYQKLTPNLMVNHMDASLKFYTEGLGFNRTLAVPDEAPFVFAGVAAGSVEIFLNRQESGNVQAGGMSMYLEVEGLDQLLERVQRNNINIHIQLNETFYGTREFAVVDPDGYMLIFAERIKK
jgi:lactoylglutathione lyase